jgi:hypothetical protein
MTTAERLANPALAPDVTDAELEAQAAAAADAIAAAEDIAVGWLLRLRQLQADGLDFDTALAQANKEYPS